MIRTLSILVAMVAALSVPLTSAAQTPESEGPSGEAQFQVRARRQGATTPSPVVDATRLPITAARLREMGLGEADLVLMLGALRDNRVAAGEAARVLNETARSMRRYGRVDNFGTFVTEQIRQGMRGRELAEAIQQEHMTRGQGRRSRDFEERPDRRRMRQQMREGEPERSASPGRGEGSGMSPGGPEFRRRPNMGGPIRAGEGTGMVGDRPGQRIRGQQRGGQ
ncbi:MAG: hypothetical protein JW797_02035 [Bradymonadales bacterium]|nr:hypothetical protein [Bradymonadales bacterium]